MKYNVCCFHFRFTGVVDMFQHLLSLLCRYLADKGCGQGLIWFPLSIECVDIAAPSTCHILERNPSGDETSESSIICISWLTTGRSFSTIITCSDAAA